MSVRHIRWVSDNTFLWSHKYWCVTNDGIEKVVKSWIPCGCGNWFKLSSTIRKCEMCDPEVYYHYDMRRLSEIAKKSMPGHEKKKYFSLDADHIVPKWFGASRRIPAHDMCSFDNMQWLSPEDNAIFRPHSKGSLLPEQWIAMLTERNYEYFLNGIPYLSILDMCDTNGLPYIKIAPLYVKNWPNGFEYRGNKLAVEEL